MAGYESQEVLSFFDVMKMEINLHNIVEPFGDLFEYSVDGTRI